MESTHRHVENRAWPEHVQQAVFEVEDMLQRLMPDPPQEGARKAVRILLWNTQEYGIRVAEVDWQIRHDRGTAGACSMQVDVDGGGMTCFFTERLLVAMTAADPFFETIPMTGTIEDNRREDIEEARWRLLMVVGGPESVKKWAELTETLPGYVDE